jgi:uncharacterized LabA/DUF88 family protein
MKLVDHLDHLVLFSGDGDFRSLVEAVQAKGRKVSVISTLSTRPPMVADDLRRQADQFIDILDMRPEIGRDASDRDTRKTERAVVGESDDFEDFANI